MNLRIKTTTYIKIKSKVTEKNEQEYIKAINVGRWLCQTWVD